MKNYGRLFWSVCSLLCLVACSREAGSDSQSSESSVVEESKAHAAVYQSDPDMNTGLMAYMLKLDEMIVQTLPRELHEISGLATSPDGRLFGHNDERGIVYQIDPESGDILKRFRIGALGMKEDFEGIAIVGKRFFLVSSSGDLFEFAEAEDGGASDLTHYETKLSSKYDVEGLCYDAANNALLLLCKEYPGKGFDKDDERTVYSFSLTTMELLDTPRFVLPVKKISKDLDLKKVKPSGIEPNPATGGFYIVSSNRPAIIEIASDGSVLASHTLPSSALKQPEGVTIDQDGRLLIASEGGRLAILTPGKGGD